MSDTVMADSIPDPKNIFAAAAVVVVVVDDSSAAAAKARALARGLMVNRTQIAMMMLSRSCVRRGDAKDLAILAGA